MCHFHLESSNPCRAMVSQLMLPWWWQKHHANILAAAIFRPEGLSSGGCLLPTDTAQNSLHAPWLLSMFPQSRGSAVALFDFGSVFLGCYAGMCSPCPARSGSACLSPVLSITQVLSGDSSRATRSPHRRQVKMPPAPSPRETCLFVRPV